MIRPARVKCVKPMCRNSSLTERQSHSSQQAAKPWLTTMVLVAAITQRLRREKAFFRQTQLLGQPWRKTKRGTSFHLFPKPFSRSPQFLRRSGIATGYWWQNRFQRFRGRLFQLWPAFVAASGIRDGRILIQRQASHNPSNLNRV
jgi:hypothetical protein